jgi:hypothetical protein
LLAVRRVPQKFLRWIHDGSSRFLQPVSQRFWFAFVVANLLLLLFAAATHGGPPGRLVLPFAALTRNRSAWSQNRSQQSASSRHMVLSSKLGAVSAN